MNKSTKIFLASGIGIIVILIPVSIIFAIADKNSLTTPQFSVILNFAATMGTLLAVALALIAIGYSIKKADIQIYFEKNKSQAGTLLSIMVRNTGDAFGDLAVSTIKINVPSSSPVVFSQGTLGLPFQTVALQDPNRKLFRFDNQKKPEKLFPGSDTFRFIGFIDIPPGSPKKFKVTVQVLGTQGLTKANLVVKI